MPSPNQLRYRIIIKNKKLRSSNEFSGNMGKAILQRTTTMDEPADNDEEYDSDFGEDEFEDEQGTLNVAEIDLNIQGGRSMILLFGAYFHGNMKLVHVLLYDIFFACYFGMIL